MKTKSAIGMAFVAGAVALSGCAGNQPPYDQNSSTNTTFSNNGNQQQSSSQSGGYQSSPQSGGYYGTVDRIEVVNKGAGSNAAGMVIGGIVGGLIGSQIGAGTGNTVATVAGVAGGAYAGSQIQQRQRATHETFRVVVRAESGSYQTITTDNLTDLRTGDRVRIDANGNISRY